MVSDALPEVCGIQLQHSLSKLCPSGALLVAPMACSRLSGCMRLSAMTSFTPSSHGTRWNRDVAASSNNSRPALACHWQPDSE